MLFGSALHATQAQMAEPAIASRVRWRLCERSLTRSGEHLGSAKARSHARASTPKDESPVVEKEERIDVEHYAPYTGGEREGAAVVGSAHRACLSRLSVPAGWFHRPADPVWDRQVHER